MTTAVIALLIFLGGISSNLVAAYIQTPLEPYKKWVWAFSAVALVVAIIAAIRDAHSSDNEASPSISASSQQAVAFDQMNNSQIATGNQNQMLSHSSIQGPVQMGGIHHYHYPSPQSSIQQAEHPSVEKKLDENGRLFSVPFPRNKFFTGREDTLSRIHSRFKKGENIQSLNGLGGIGKTQTALEYAYRRRDQYNIVLWAGANSRETLVTDFVQFAGLLRLPEKDAQDQNQAIAAVKRWLDNNSAWLLILDNADEIEMAEEFIPSNGLGHILLTSRAHATGEIVEGNALEKMNPEEGAFFLLRRSKKIKKDETLKSAAAELSAQAEAISTMLDGLPLALDQAGAFIEEKSSSLEEYQALYNNECERLELLKRRGNLAKDHQSVAVTFSLAFKKVEDANRATADLLRVCAFLEADSIPEEIFSAGATKLGKALTSIAESPLGLSEAIEKAARFSLIHRQPEARTLSVHRLVQEVLKGEMSNKTKLIWVERLIRAVESIFPNIEHSNWTACGRLVSHAQKLALLIDENGFNFPEASRLINRAGFYLSERAQYREAEPLLKRALAMAEREFDAEHPFVTICLNNLAALYDDQGKYEEAEPLYQRALALCEKSLGPEHPEVATILNNLAVVYSNWGKYEKAEPLFQRALSIREKTFCPHHPYVANSLTNLAGLYDDQGRYGEAEMLLKRALAIVEKALASEHPSIATILINLSNVHYHQRKFGEAEPLLKRALAVLEKGLDPEHPDVATCLNNYGAFYEVQERYEEAEPLFQRVLAIREKVFTPEHPFVADSLITLAHLYYKQMKYKEAEPLLKKALAIREKAFGPEHPDVATIFGNLTSLFRAMGEQSQADELEARASTIRKRNSSKQTQTRFESRPDENDGAKSESQK